MKFALTIDCENAAFADDLRLEIHWILEQAADVIFNTHDREGTLRDSNGNRVGTWRLA